MSRYNHSTVYTPCSRELKYILIIKWQQNAIIRAHNYRLQNKTFKKWLTATHTVSRSVTRVAKSAAQAYHLRGASQLSAKPYLVANTSRAEPSQIDQSRRGLNRRDLDTESKKSRTYYSSTPSIPVRRQLTNTTIDKRASWLSGCRIQTLSP